MALQLKPTAPKVIIEVKNGEAVVIGKAVTKPKWMHSKGPVESHGVNGRLSETSELPNGGPSGQASHGEAECDATAEPKESDSSDDTEYLSCDE